MQSVSSNIFSGRYYKRPAIPLILGIILGIVIGIEIPGYKLSAYFAVLFCVCLGTALFVYKKSIRVIPIILFIILGYLLIQPWAGSVLPGPSISPFLDVEKYNITGIVETRPVVKGHRQVFILRTEKISGKITGDFDISRRIRVTIAGRSQPLKQGDKIGFKSKLRSFRNFNNPGGFDYERYMRFKDVCARAYANNDKLFLYGSEAENFIVKARSAVEELIERSIGETRTIGVLKALVTGNRNGIDEKLKEEFNRTGTGHLLAISGLHMGIVCSASFLFFCWVLSYFQVLLWNGYVKKIAGLLSLIPVLAYGALSGMSPPTQRAVIMVSVFLLAYSFEAEHDVINTMGIAALIILVFSPASLYFASFQLSFAAVFSVVWGMSNLKLKEDFQLNRAEMFKRAVLSYSLVSVFAFAGTLPLVLYYFNQASLIGIPANLVLVPVIGFFVVPASLAGAFIYPVSHSASEMLIRTAGFFLEKSLELVHGLSDVSFSAIKTITPSHLEIICYYALLGIGFYFTGKKESMGKPERKIFVIAFTAVFAVLFLDAAYWVGKRWLHRDLRVSFLDVGQGGATLLEFPGGECMLVDGGGFSDNSSFDVGEKIVAPFLWKNKIGKIKTVVLTHPESDHLNGLLYILKHFKVENIWASGQGKKTKAYREFKTIVAQDKINLIPLDRLHEPMEKSGVKIRVMWPPADAPIYGNSKNTNNNSIVMQVEYGSYSFLLPGDIMAAAEKKIVGLFGEDLKSNILVLPHHGSNSSNTKEFLDAVSPEAVIISCGWKNRFRLPHEKVLKRLKEREVKFYRTDLNGAIVMSTSGVGAVVETVLKTN